MPTLNEAREVAKPAASKPAVAPPDGQTKAVDPKPVKEPKTKAEPTDCACQVPGDGGCKGAKSTRKFAPGHDAKLVGYLTREVVAGNMAYEDAIARVNKASGNSALLRGKVESGVKREKAKVDAKAARERAAAEKKEAEVAAKANTEATAAASA